VSRFLFLDSGPLGLLTNPHRTEEIIAVNEWLGRWLLNGNRVLVPAIVYYEIKRELLRSGRTLGLDRLQAFVNAAPGRYVLLSDQALRLAAELWAESRRQGQPTADRAALDVDVILAAQVLSVGQPLSEVVLATTNPKHLSRFVPAQLWSEILS
jgi:predicted nucleic acid-binding protein